MEDSDEQLELLVKEMPTGLNLIPDKSQLCTLIIINGEKIGSMSEEKLKCRGLKSTLSSLSFLITLQSQFIRAISCIDCGVTDDNVILLLEAARIRGGRLNSLDLSNNLLGSAAMFHIALYLKEFGLKHLNLSKNRLCDVWTSRGCTKGSYNPTGICHLLDGILECSSFSLAAEHLPFALESLDISRNMLGQDESLMMSLCGLIDKNLSHLTALNLTGNCFHEVDMIQLMSSIDNNDRILSYCGLGLFKSNRKKLSLSGCNLAPLDFLFLKTNLSTELVGGMVDFSWNREFGSGSVSYPGNCFAFLNLKSLRLNSVSMDSDYALHLRHVLEDKSCCLLSLDVAGNSSSLDNEGFSHLLQGLKGNQSLQWLSLRSCFPKGYRSHHLVQETLEMNTTLRVLDLSQASGSHFDATPVFLALKTNTTLETLRMSRCGINAAGVIHLSDVIDQNKSLLCLDLSHNYICKSGWGSEFDIEAALAFVVSLRHANDDVEQHSGISEWFPVSYMPPTEPSSFALRELNLSHNRIASNVLEAFCQALENPRLMIETLNVSFCGIGISGGVALGSVLGKVSCLKTLLLGSNGLGVQGLVSVIYGASSNTSLCHLGLAANNIPRLHAVVQPPVEHNEGMIMLAMSVLLAQNTTIQQVDLQKNRLFGVNYEANEYRYTTMRTLAEGIRENSRRNGSLVQLNILNNEYHVCYSVGMPYPFWSRELFCAHLSLCHQATCPAVCLHEAVREMRNHPTMKSLFGIDACARKLQIDVGSSVSSPIMWALFQEISHHEILEEVEFPSLRSQQDELEVLSDWLIGNSLLKKVRVSSAQVQALKKGREKSMELRLSVAVLVRGLSFLGSAAVRAVVENVYGVGRQANKFLKYKTYSGTECAAEVNGRMRVDG